MIKIAITGGIASGKSMVEDFFRQEGAAALDTDKVVHELLENDANIINKVCDLFISDVNIDFGVFVSYKSLAIFR